MVSVALTDGWYGLARTQTPPQDSKMQILCPNCAAAYQVSATAIGGSGRSVRCVRCRSVWLQLPVAEVAALTIAPAAVRQPASDETIAAFKSELGNEPQPAPEAEREPPAASAPTPENGDAAGPSLADLMAAGAAEPPASEAQAEPASEAAPALAEIAIPAETAPPTVPNDDTPADTEGKAPGNIESIAARRRRPNAARRRFPVRGSVTPAIILVLAGVIASLIGWRANIVKQVPQLASLYAAIGMPVNLRGLTFSDVRVSRETQDGVPVLVVEGSIASAASQPVEVPRLRLAMRNDAGGEIYAWTAMPTKEALAPGETLPFRSRLAAPPGEGRDVTVRFFTRLDAVAGLR